jgi:hypothetical protein
LLNVVKVIVTLILIVDTQKIYKPTSIVPEEKAASFFPQLCIKEMAGGVAIFFIKLTCRG